MDFGVDLRRRDGFNSAAPGLVPVAAVPLPVAAEGPVHFPNLEAERVAIHAALDAAPRVTGPALEAEPDFEALAELGRPALEALKAAALELCPGLDLEVGYCPYWADLTLDGPGAVKVAAGLNEFVFLPLNKTLDSDFVPVDMAAAELVRRCGLVAGPLELVEVLDAEPVVNLSELVGFDVTAGPVALTPLELAVSEIDAALALELADLPPRSVEPCAVEADLTARAAAAKSRASSLYSQRAALLEDLKAAQSKLTAADKQLGEADKRKDPDAHRAKWGAIIPERIAVRDDLDRRILETERARDAAYSEGSALTEQAAVLARARITKERAAAALHDAAIDAAKVARIEAAVKHAPSGRIVMPSAPLIAAARSVSKCTSKRSINPVMGYMELSLEGDRLRVVGTDGDMSLVRYLEVKDCELPVPVLVPSRLFLDTVARMPGVGRKDSMVSLVFEPRAGRDSVEYGCKVVGAGREVNLTCLGADNFPVLADPRAYDCEALVSMCMPDFKRALCQVVFSAVKESSTGGVHYTNGVLLSFLEGALRVVATDGHRLAYKRLTGLAGVPSRELLLPARAADLLEKLLSDKDLDAAVELYHFKGCAYFVWADTVLVTSLIDVKFPDFERVIPKDIDTRLHLSREALLGSLPGAMLMSRQKDQNPVCKFEVNEAKDRLLLTADAGEIGRFEDSLPCEAAGGDFKVALDPGYLLDCLKVLGGDQVTLNWISEVNPVMVTSPRDPDWTYIVMPIRLD